MALDFYTEPDEGVSALDELSAINGARPGEVAVILEAASAVIENGGGALFDSCSWGYLYLLESGRCFGFLRHAPDSATKWLFLMFGEWMRDVTLQKIESARRFANSGMM